LDSRQGLDQELPRFLILDIVSRHIVGDVGQQLGKEGYFKELVRSNDSKVVQALLADVIWWSTVGQGSQGLILDLPDLVGVRIGKSILQGEGVEASSSRPANMRNCTHKGGGEAKEGRSGDDERTHRDGKWKKK